MQLGALIPCVTAGLSLIKVVLLHTYVESRINCRFQVIKRSSKLHCSAIAWLWLWSINIGYTKLNWFLRKSDQVLRFFLYFLEWRNAEVTQMAKLRFSKQFYYVRNWLGFSKDDFLVTMEIGEHFSVLTFFDRFLNPVIL